MPRKRIPLPDWIAANRTELDALILKKFPPDRPPLLTDADRRYWVLVDDWLYLRAKLGGAQV